MGPVRVIENKQIIVFTCPCGTESKVVVSTFSEKSGTCSSCGDNHYSKLKDAVKTALDFNKAMNTYKSASHELEGGPLKIQFIGEFN